MVESRATPDPPPLDPPGRERPAADALPHLRRAFEAGRGEHPGVGLSLEAFAAGAAAALRRRLQREGRAGSAAELHRAWKETAHADLYLALACEARLPGAWEALCREFLPRLEALARRRGSGAEQAHEVAHDTIDSLGAPPCGGGGGTRLGSYDGSVRLFSWLGVVLLRRLADVARARRARPLAPGSMPASPNGAPPRRLLSAATDPAQGALDEEARQALDDTFRDAWSRLAPRSRLALLLKYRDGLRQTEIARLLGVGTPRVSRILSAALAELRRAAERRFPEAGDGASGPTRHALVEVLARRLATSTPDAVLPAGKERPRG